MYNPTFQMPPVVKNLIIINVIMLLATLVFKDVMYEYLGLFYPASPFFKPYQFVTHMFMHGGFLHLFFNMYTLWIFGTALEYVWGSKRFFTFYIITGLGAAAIHMLVMWIDASSLQNAIAAGDVFARSAYHDLLRTPTVGASGAIYGVLLGYGMLFPNNVLRLIFPPIALKAKWFVIIFGALELVLGLSNRGSQIAHFAHLGGMIFAYFLIVYWRKRGQYRF